MNLLHLEYFMRLAETEHLNKTAEMLNLTPSTLSASLARLERELGAKLFDRVGRRLKLNRYGKICYRCGTEVFRALENARNEIEDARGTNRKSLIIGLTNPLLWEDAFHCLRTAHPEISFQLRSFDTGAEFCDVKSLDLIVAALDSLRDPSLKSRTLFYDEVLLAVRKDHPFARRESIDLSEAKNEWFVNSLRNTSFRKYCDDLCLQAGFMPKTQIECDYVLRARMIVNENMVGLITRRGAMSGLYDETAHVRLRSPRCSRAQALFWHKDQYQTAAMETIRDFLAEYYRDYRPLDR